MPEKPPGANPPQPPSRKWTYFDLTMLPEDGKRHEILDGVHYVTPPPTAKHQVVLAQLYHLVRACLAENPAGQVQLSPFHVVFSRFDVVEPDLLFVSNERSELLTPKNVQGAPDLVAEVLSESNWRHDEIVKRPIYERYGVKEFWIVDPEGEKVKTYRRGETRFGPVVHLSKESADVLTTPLVPHLSIPLRALFGG